MSESTVAIVGAGFSASVLAHQLASRGIDVVLFEKGPPFGFPHVAQYESEILRGFKDPRFRAAPDLQQVVTSGDYPFDLNQERAQVVGGAGTHWAAISLRMRPQDFETQQRFGFGMDWPFGYAELEPYYGHAERLIGVSGTDDDNPFAPPRSTAYPLPPFPFADHDHVVWNRLKARGLHLHTTPQARARNAYDGRSACLNYGVCHVCPTGARYAPNHHLERAVATGRCQVWSDTSVRRVAARAGHAPVIVFRRNGEPSDREHRARILVLSGGVVETVRLMLMSTEGGDHPHGLGNHSGHLGRHFMLHHSWWNNDVFYPEAVYAGRFGGFTAQSHQFLDPETRGRHGGLKIEFTAHSHVGKLERYGTRAEVLAQIQPRRHARSIVLQAETVASAEKYIALSDQADRWGDPFAHVHYRSSDFDHATFEFARSVHDSFVPATGADATKLPDEATRYGSGAHHFGGARMGTDASESVVDPMGRIHGYDNLYVTGAATFPTCTGAVNPTLTVVATTLRLADMLTARLGAPR